MEPQQHSTSTSSSTYSGSYFFTPIPHPTLLSLGRNEIHNFIRARQQYLLKIQDVQNSSSNTTTVSLKNSIDFDLLQSLIDLDEFKEVSKIDELQDNHIQTWLTSIDDQVGSTLFLQDFETKLALNVTTNMKESDVKVRIKSVFVDYLTYLRKHKWETLLDTNTKLCVTHMCKILKPYDLRLLIENDLKTIHSDLKNDWNKFYKHVLSEAEHAEKIYQQSMQRRRDKLEKQKESNVMIVKYKNNKSSATHSSSNSNNDRSVSTGSQESANLRNTNSSNGQLSRRSPPKCLNTAKCNGYHLVHKCPVSSAEEIDTLLKAYKAKMASSTTPSSSTVTNTAPPSEATKSGTPQGKAGCLSRSPASEKSYNARGRYFGKLADTTDVIINGDYGCDHCALSTSQIEELQNKNFYIPILPLQDVVTMSGPTSENSDGKPLKLTARSKVMLTTTIFTSAGPVCLRNVIYLVFDQPMDEILLSRPLLQSIGFDLDKHLIAVRDKYHNVDFSEVGFEPSTEGNYDTHDTVPPLSCKLLTHNNNEKLEELSLTQESPFICQESTPDLDETHLQPIELSQQQNHTAQLENENELQPGRHDVNEVKQQVHLVIQDAIDNGLPTEYHASFSNLINEYVDVFRTKIGSDPPIKSEPLKIRLQPDASPVRVRVRKYSLPQRQFLEKKIDELLSLGLIYRNVSSQWASAPLIVPKSGPDQYRLTIDLRPVNKQTIPTVWPMPNLEAVLSTFSGDKYFANVDLCHGYWQLALHQESQECLSFITPTGVYTPTRVLQGQSNAAQFFQAVIQELCNPIKKEIIQWIDDLLFHTKTVPQLLTSLRSFFQICRQNNIKLNVRKCRFFLIEVKWCGRLISEKGIRLDPARIQGLTNMPIPATGNQLQQFLCASNWLRSCLPQYTTLVAPLQVIMTEVYDKSSKRTTGAVKKIKLSSTSWNETHTESFNRVKQAIKQAVTLAHPKSSHRMCLYTDASDHHWSGILTQVPHDDLNLPFEQQQHEPLSFLSGSFTGSSLRWSTIEKEAYAIYACVTRLDYLLHPSSGFSLFTDHKNLRFIYDPLATHPGLGKHVLHKVHRWAMYLMEYNYTITHINGCDNVWADLLSRWGANPEPPHRLCSLFTAPLAPTLDPDFKWPAARDILEIQHKRIPNEVPPNLLTLHNGLLANKKGAVWLPSSSTQLQLRICIIGHCGRSGHRGFKVTLDHIKEYFTWAQMDVDIKTFCDTCLHCMSTISGTRIPRPFSHTLHSDTPNEILHFDYLYMGPSQEGFTYVLILKDDASSFVWLEPCVATNALTTSTVLLKWFTLFGIVPMWISDRGSHFKNQLVHHINKELHADHHFTIPYHPQSNGTVESVCKQLLRACRALLSELRINESRWPRVLPLIQSILNHTKRKSFGGVAPITAFTALPADNPLRTVILDDGQPTTVTKDFVRLQKVSKIQLLISAVDDMHKEIAARKTRTRKDAISTHNRRTNVSSINFTLGDFVLVAQANDKEVNKLLVRWKGPYQITRCLSDYSYEVKDIVHGSHRLVHSSRMKLYADSQLNLTEELRSTAAHNNPKLLLVEEFLDIRFNANLNHYELLTRWKDFDYEEPGWEPLPTMFMDVPVMVRTFLSACQDRALADAALQSVTK